MITKILEVTNLFDSFVILLALFSIAIFVVIYGLNLIKKGVKHGRHMLKSRRTHKKV